MDKYLDSGMLLLDKPKHLTSFKSISIIKNILKANKCGHCGSLDPMATGLLLVLINNAVKLQDIFMKQDKTYRASILLGISTDTYDLEGKIIDKKNADSITLTDIQNTLQSFIGEIEQIPPMYSALKVKGKKLYELARKGIIIERTPRKIRIDEIEIISFEKLTLDLLIKCSSGTYIRSFANDIGTILGCGAVLSSLRRERIGKFNVCDSVNEKDFDNVDKLKDSIIDIEKLKISEQVI